MRHRYPFEALQRLRHKRVDQRATEVSEQAARTALARAAEARAKLARHGAERALRELSSAEQARLDDGGVRAGDLARVGDWRKAAEADVRQKAQRQKNAEDAVRGQVSAELTARVALGTASSQAKVVDTHQGDWRAERDSARERSEEEAAVEQWTAKRYPPRS